ncbi:MAG: hypothetical protein ACR2M7_00550 [Bdellovibrionales bacterium]
MAKIEDTKNKKKKENKNNSYMRVFGDKQLGKLITDIHSTTIVNGIELQKIIFNKARNRIENLDNFLSQSFTKDVFVASKDEIKGSSIESKRRNLITGKEEKIEIDLLIFKNDKCYIIELKDGDNFDTKKASIERDRLIEYLQYIGHKINYKTSIHFCCFNQDSKKSIVQGFKNKIKEEEAMTGKDLCKLLELDYQEIVNERKNSQKENREYFFNEVFKIEWLREKFPKK